LKTKQTKHYFTFGFLTAQGNGVVTVKGLLDSFVGEIFRFSDVEPSYGTIVNLTRDDTMNLVVSGLQFQPEVRVHIGGVVLAGKCLPNIIVGDTSLGSINDGLMLEIARPTRSMSGSSNRKWVIESPAIGIVDRQSVFEPMQTGILAIDSMIPIGRGQRELILGDRYTGKSSICIDAILNQRLEKVVCVYASIGQKASSVLEVFISMLARDALRYLIFIVASGSSSSTSQFIGVYTGTAVSEFWMLLKRCSCLYMMDDLTKHAVAYREIYLLLRRPPGREAYPGEIFFVHSRLLERSALVSEQLGGGSVTGFPVIETLGGDVSAYITTNVISITDGQIFLSVDLFLSGVKPAIDVGLSVTRVGSAAQWDGMKLVGSSYKLELAQFMELQSFSQFASDLGAETKARLERGTRLVELLKQPNGSPISLGLQVYFLSIANQNLISYLETDSITSFKSYFCRIPFWIYVYVSPRLVALSIIQLLKH
jgi:F-type H+-transporting ATPase subunit alpha